MDFVRKTLGNDKALLKRVFNSFFAITDFITVQENGSMFCPFHDDERGGKPSAKFYLDEDGIERIYCYSEGRQFTAYDCVKILENKNPLVYLLTKVPVLDIKTSIEENAEMSHKREESIKLLLQGKTPQEIIELICIGEK